MFSPPENFIPIELKVPSKGNSYSYWVYNKQGESIDYLEATSKDIEEWVGSVMKTENREILDFLSSNAFLLSSTKKAFLDIAHASLFFQSSLLFGGEEYWNTIEEWKRLRRMEEKDKKKKEENGEE